MALNQFPRRAFSGAATIQTFTGNGSTTAFTLSQAQTQNECFVYVDDVAQVPGVDFTINSTTLTFTSAPANSSEIIVRGFGVPTPLNSVSDNSITTAKLADTSVTAAKLSSTAISDKLGYTPVSPTQLSTEVANLVNSAPAALNTLSELATALGNDANFATTVTNSIATKANTSSLASIATSGSASDLNTGTLPSARLSAASTNIVIPMADSGGTAQWLYLGQWDTAQMGYRIHIKINGNAGFNADINQNSNVEVHFKTSNNSSSQTGSSGNYYADGYVMSYAAGAAAISPSIIRVVQTSSTSYKFYAYVSQYTGVGSYFTVDITPGTTWTSAVTWTSPSGNYIDLPYRNTIATTTTGSVSNQSNSFAIPINPSFGTSIVYLRGRHDTGVATAYMATYVNGSQVSTETSLFGTYRGNSGWADSGATSWSKLHPNTLVVDAGLDWGGVFVVQQTYNTRPGVMVDFKYTYTAQGAARTSGYVSYVGTGSITALVFDFDISAGTQNMWAEWQVVGIK